MAGSRRAVCGKANASYLIAATLIVCFGYYLRALRWKVLLEPLTETSLRELFAATTVGFAVIMIVGQSRRTGASDVAFDARPARSPVGGARNVGRRANFRPRGADLFFRRQSVVVYAAAGTRTANSHTSKLSEF
ncbi:MAG: hypothetical protein WKF71_11590 [Pyrinomonadaceae bacterium]